MTRTDGAAQRPIVKVARDLDAEAHWQPRDPGAATAVAEPGAKLQTVA